MSYFIGDIMKKAYEQNEVKFSLILIFIYVFGTILSEILTEKIGIIKLIPAIFHIILSIFLFRWIKNNSLMRKYGLVNPLYPIKEAWYFIPLLLIALSGLIGGIKLNYNIFETILYMISMIFVGFLEEIIFRGFLFLGMAKNNLHEATIISSITFGFGHIVNLFSGAPIFTTIMQIIFATVVGFTLVILFYKGGSLIPCIIFHSLNNSLSAIELTNVEAARILSINESTLEFLIIIIHVIILLIYYIFSLRKFDPKYELRIN